MPCPWWSASLSPFSFFSCIAISFCLSSSPQTADSGSTDLIPLRLNPPMWAPKTNRSNTSKYWSLVTSCPTTFMLSWFLLWVWSQYGNWHEMTWTYITILLYPSFKICFFPTSSWFIHFIPSCSHHFTPHHTTFAPPSDRRCVSAWLPSVGCCHPGGPADGMPMGRWWENIYGYSHQKLD